MISDTKPQNAIVVITLIAAIISAMSLYSTASYYSGSYVLVQKLDVELVEIRLGNFHPENETINPSVAADFQFVAPATGSGTTRLYSLTVSIYLNGESFDYSYFRKIIPLEDRLVTSGYNKTFTVSSTIDSEIDKQLIFDAYSSGDWTWTSTMRLFYIVFESPAQSVRVLTFTYSGYVLA
ncbi:hypothetical protein EU546_07155 [Candidatus Thorarchaeota archaeon]|nr:MAG: hypothetical protein EU546_07155 [Candidatus Thorarchaeota archaeon]